MIHNIDGNCLRDSSIQNCLSELAANRNIRIIATVDHINSPLRKSRIVGGAFRLFGSIAEKLRLLTVWDQTQYTMFRWIHFEIHTLMAYNDEIMFENSLMLGQAGT